MEVNRVWILVAGSQRNWLAWKGFPGVASKAATRETRAVTLTDASSLMSARRFAGACKLEYFWVPGE